MSGLIKRKSSINIAKLSNEEKFKNKKINYRHVEVQVMTEELEP